VTRPHGSKQTFRVVAASITRSAYTFWMKYVFSSIWISGFGAAICSMFCLARGKNGDLPPEAMKYAWRSGVNILWSRN
jgi:hypothetical protein